MTNEQNFVSKGAVIKIVDTLPAVGDVANGEMFFLTSDSKIYVKVTEGFITTGNALS